MAARKPRGVAARKSTRRREPGALPRRLSALVGGILICVALLWFGWLLARQHNPGLASVRFPFSGPQTQPTADPLLAAGITLTTPAQGQTASLNRQQALLLADQMEPQAAAHANSVSADYVLLNYKGSANTTAALHDVPAWLVHYSKVSGAAPDTAADPHAANTPHDCYLFLDATTGQELLALWV